MAGDRENLFWPPQGHKVASEIDAFPFGTSAAVGAVMPSATHEGLVTAFRHRPQLALELVRGAGGRPPAARNLTVMEADLGSVDPTERRADVVLRYTDRKDRPCAMVVEVQLDVDEDKFYRWPEFLANLAGRLHAKVFLLVIAPNASVAAWARGKIALGHPGWILVPWVIGPEELPLDAADYANASVEMVLLALVAHGRKTQAEALLDAFAQAVDDAEGNVVPIYEDVAWAAVQANYELRKKLEARMETHYEFQSPFYRRIIAQARTEGLNEGRKEGLNEGRKEGLNEGRKEGLNEGRKEGLNKGRKEGRKKGLDKGRKEGRDEGRKEAMRDAVRNLLATGCSREETALLLGLTAEEMEALG